jgi:Protein of unknown function (DUF4232)
VARPRLLSLGVAFLLATGGILVSGPVLQSGASHKLLFCSLESGLRAKNDGTNGASGSTYFYIVYVNAGSTACVLQGIPGVEPTAGLTHGGVGPSSKREKAGGRGGRVRLAPHGGTANTVYWTFVTAEEPPRCHAKATNGVMIHFAGVRAFFVAIHPPSSLASDVCTTLQSTTTDGVSAGFRGP